MNENNLLIFFSFIIWTFVLYPLNLKFTITEIFSTLMAESEEELNSLLMRVNEKSEKAGLKLNIQKTKIKKKKKHT